jgi:hypothetical protein
MHHVRAVSIVEQILCVIKQLHHHFVHVKHIINIIHHYVNVVVIQVLYVIERQRNVWIMRNAEMEHVNVQINLYLMKIEYVVRRWISKFLSNEIMVFISMNLVDPCPAQIPNPARIRYPSNCQRFIDCQQK